MVGPVIEFALSRPDVDPARIALLGNSMGGVLTPRAAAFEPRIAALITLDGVYDLGTIATMGLPGDRAEIERRLRADSDPELDEVLDRAAQESPTLRWAIAQGRFTFGVDTAREFCAAYLDYHVRDGIAERITCPTLVCAGTEDGFFKGQPELLYAHLTCPKTLLSFTAAEGADAHCQSGAQRLAFARVYDWLDDTFEAAVSG
ncbi:alpha/beta hydrolase family protein [Nocardia acidivorans]|uniref:alpha/beta hydrolase family protein n=1 Tax=Nocardia acidivorans TaxID=404580 RepID=UPI000A7E3179|nr:acetylxylan esterase [Nocardia acidivorans]